MVSVLRAAPCVQRPPHSERAKPKQNGSPPSVAVRSTICPHEQTCREFSLGPCDEVWCTVNKFVKSTGGDRKYPIRQLSVFGAPRSLSNRVRARHAWPRIPHHRRGLNPSDGGKIRIPSPVRRSGKEQEGTGHRPPARSGLIRRTLLRRRQAPAKILRGVNEKTMGVGARPVATSRMRTQ